MGILDQIVMRPIHPDDAENQYAMISDPRVAKDLMQLPSMELAAVQEWIQVINPGKHRLVADLNGRHIGSIGLQQNLRPRLQHSGSIGLMVHPDFWGQGVGSKMMTAILDLADNWLNLHRVELEVYTHNEVARHLYQKFGFAVEGTKRQAVFGEGDYFDTHVMARLRHPEWYADLPAQPLPDSQRSQTKIDNVTIRPPAIPR